MEGLMGGITDWPDSEDCKDKVVVKIDDDE